MRILLALLVACDGGGPVDAPSCPSPMNEGWAPILEEETRVDETVAFTSSLTTALSDVGCREAPCLHVSGAGELVAEARLNRGDLHRLQLEVTGSATARIVTINGDRRVTRAEVSGADGALSVDFTLVDPFDRAELVLAVEGPETVVDGLAITTDAWSDLGGLDGPAEVLLGFAIHVEADPSFETDAAAWGRPAAVIARLSSVLAARGATLTLQADPTFARGTARFGAEWLAAREAEGMAWSGHLHAPEDAAALERAARAARSAASELGLRLTDINTAFNTGSWAVLADAGYTSLSAFKDGATQRGLALAYTTPWRPPDGAGASDESSFVVHDPDGPLLYLPGLASREADPDRVAPRGVAAMSQVLARARPGFVNTWYFMDHVDGYGAGLDAGAFEAYAADGLDDDLQGYGALLDALAAGGAAVRPVGLPEMASAHEDWQQGCVEGASAKRVR